jgi:hypothetical protein
VDAMDVEATDVDAMDVEIDVEGEVEVDVDVEVEVEVEVDVQTIDMEGEVVRRYGLICNGPKTLVPQSLLQSDAPATLDEFLLYHTSDMQDI